MTRTLTSGEMVRESGLSIKALRLYDSNGLLVPAHVDPRTGYREYAPEQVEQARRIAVLRRLEMPLARVAEVLDADAEAARSLLLAWWVERRDALAEQRETALRLARSLGDQAVPGAGADALAAEVRRRESPGCVVAAIARPVSQTDLVPAFTADALTIRRHLSEVGAQAGAGHWVTYLTVPMAEVPGRIETCVPYTGTAVPAGDIVLRAEPPRSEAYLPVLARDCAYPRIVDHHEAVRPLGGGAPTREIYLGVWGDDPDEVVAEVAVRV